LLANRSYTNIKSSSAPLKRKIIGRGGIQPDSAVTLANSSIDAAKQANMQTEMTKHENS